MQKNRWFSFYLLIPLLGLILSSCASLPEEESIGLDGSWQFRMDSSDRGVEERWFLKEFTAEVILPGSMKENGKGQAPDLHTQWTGSIYDSSWFFNPKLEKYRKEKPLKFAFWLSPDLYYKGPAWYRRSINIPESWKDRQVELILERPHWETSIWIDSVFVSNQNSLSTPHVADLSALLSPGKHNLTIRVDNRLDEVNVGPDSHSVSDHTQGNWNGIIGEIALRIRPRVNIASVQLYPSLEKQLIKAVIAIHNPNEVKGEAVVRLSANSLPPAKRHHPETVEQIHQITKERDTLIMEIPMGSDFNIWNEFNPNLYDFTAELIVDTEKSYFRDQFGMREIRVSGRQILVNGLPVFLRGNVDCCVFPLTGYPPMYVEKWIEVFEVLKGYGLNHVRFHSWCPPEAAFIAADQLGLYLQPEGPSWPNHGTSLGNGRSIDQYIYEETERIVESYGNHPSFCLFASGNEPRGNYVAFLEEFLAYWKQKDKRRIYTGASIGGSWKECNENQFHVKGGARGLPWKKRPGSSFDYNANIARFDVPFITHELGQYCVFPDFKEISKYTGTYKAGNFEIFRDMLEDKHMGDQADVFLAASGELQKRCYKYEMEASLRTKGMTGYQLLGINDFPGQGTALVGVLNSFYEEKGYASPEYFRQFCNPVTLLAELPKFVYTAGELFTAGMELSNYGSDEISNEKINWTITDENGQELAQGEFAMDRVPVGELAEAGRVDFNTAGIKSAKKLTLRAVLGEISNNWDFWVYPENLPVLKTEVYVTDTLNKKAEKVLYSGGKVLLLGAGRVENGKDIVQYFTPVFWNTSWFKMRPPHTTGVVVRDQHPVFDNFPTNFHSDLHWWEILNRQQVMNLENFPAGFKPLVQPIDTWFLSRRLGLLWEAETGGGKLVTCSADLQNDLDTRPAAKQLLYSILHYMNSEEFHPETEVSMNIIHELFEKKERNVIKLYTRASPDELKPGTAKK